MVRQQRKQLLDRCLPFGHFEVRIDTSGSYSLEIALVRGLVRSSKEPKRPARIALSYSSPVDTMLKRIIGQHPLTERSLDARPHDHLKLWAAIGREEQLLVAHHALYAAIQLEIGRR